MYICMYAILEDAGNNIHDIQICTDDGVEVDVRKVEDEIIPSSKRNIFTASFTTSWARLELHKYLEKFKNQVLYFDTDSVIYLWREGLQVVESGPFLGQMKDETAGVPIHEFVTGAPKITATNYKQAIQNAKYEASPWMHRAVLVEF